MTFAQAFRHHRIQSGLTQKDISDFLKLDQAQMVSNVERGVGYFSRYNLKKICAKYKWDYNKMAQIVIDEKYQALKDEWLGE